ncbi:Serine/threonine-protein kinase ppk30 [Podospora fimiseda]|uniref:non-specific serine/threonine protein kinase n=1 Tax=Podospora fimiseda TaxID=252190 RepID=A0AAN7BY36_9PEZI|nr:Serine/threonine-protein kinase ppk30 [Podospora fimiseda]
MASFGHGAVPVRPAVYGAPMPGPGSVPGAPAGTFAPGTKIQVGEHRVVIQKYLSEGGFAHVYLVKLPTPINGTDLAVLKRVAVPDKESLRGMRIEVETMKKLKGHKAIVTYIDSHASELRGGGYEVFLLMEYCNGGGLIDFMNTRLQHRLTEPEILKIFCDVAEGVACMHYLRPPLLHRDLKVENVLITVTGSSKKFKLCDFGSAASPRPAPNTVVECRLMDEDVQKHTTMQYRSPEMVDVYRKQPIDEKSDIWALGVLLYKLCYYTTPFEEQGQLAILNASFKYPSYPVFSDRLKGLIGWMLRENQQSRPNIYQVLHEACSMQGREPPVKDIYSGKSQADPQQQKQIRPDSKVASPPMVGAVFSPTITQQQTVAPEVERMRRGRLPAQTVPAPAPKVTNGDPFAALDGVKPAAGATDEFSSRFPPLDHFSILHEKGAKFDFDNPSSTSPPQAKDLGTRVAEKLADEAFQVKPSAATVPAVQPSRQSVDINRANQFSSSAVVSPPPKSSSAPPPKQVAASRASAIISASPELQAISSQAAQPIYQPTTPRPVMVSTGTMTSPLPDAPHQPYRFPPDNHHRATSVPRVPDSGTSGPRMLGEGTTAGSGARTPSYQGHIRQASSARPSLEGGRPSFDMDSARTGSRVASSKPRPISTHLESNLDFLREKEGKSPVTCGRFSLDRSRPSTPKLEDDNNPVDLLDFSDSPAKKDKTSKHGKRGSLSSISAGAKNILAGKFGDAFKRFEGSSSSSSSNNNSGLPLRAPSPLKDLERHHGDLTPIQGSEAIDGRSDDGQEEDEEMTPEMRREQEAKMLAQEEARVAAAQAEYRQRVALKGKIGGGGGGVSKAIAIQNKVQSLLDETSKSTINVTRTAQGYGQYTDGGGGSKEEVKPAVPRKPSIIGQQQRPGTSSGGGTKPAPAAPPKPGHLVKSLTMNSNGSSGSLPLRSVGGVGTGGGQEALLAVDLPGGQGSALLRMTAAEKDDYIRDFQKRFPNIEMVERDLAAEDLGGGGGGEGRQR